MGLIMYITTVEGRIINLVHVSSIARYKARGSYDSEHHYYCEFTLTNGDAVVAGHVRKGQIDSLIENTLHAREIPAAAGYFLLHYEIDAQIGETISTEPIIAWRFTPGFECPSPLTVFGHSHGTSAYVQHPDGSVSDPFLSRWENHQQWLAEMRAKRLKAEDWRTVYPDHLEAQRCPVPKDTIAGVLDHG